MIDMLWATMSWSSRAMRAFSSMVTRLECSSAVFSFSWTSWERMSCHCWTMTAARYTPPAMQE